MDGPQRAGERSKRCFRYRSLGRTRGIAGSGCDAQGAASPALLLYSSKARKLL